VTSCVSIKSFAFLHESGRKIRRDGAAIEIESYNEEQQVREPRGLEDYRGFYDDDLHLISPVIVGPAMASSRNGRIPENIVTGIALVCQKNRH
jgi:hypothetical protein